MKIKHFFDSDTNTLTYAISSPSGDTVIIDPVLDFDPATGRIDDHSLHELLQYIKEYKLEIKAILETHAHADHITSSQLLKKLFPRATVGIGARIKEVQLTFKNIFNLQELKTDGSQFDRLFKDFEQVDFGDLKMKAIPTPGHTPACMSYLFEDALFTGDALFMPDSGTGRCDFPKGSANELYQSITKNLYSLPDSTRIFVGHDYRPNNRNLQYETTIKLSKSENIQLKAHTPENEYVNFRKERDQTLKAPRLLLPSIQVNIDAGHLPKKEGNGKSYLKTPLKLDLKTINFE